jgi:hypothetical protein
VLSDLDILEVSALRFQSFVSSWELLFSQFSCATGKRFLQWGNKKKKRMNDGSEEGYGLMVGKNIYRFLFTNGERIRIELFYLSVGTTEQFSSQNVLNKIAVVCSDNIQIRIALLFVETDYSNTIQTLLLIMNCLLICYNLGR